jgi:hypothetical protein
MIENQKARPAQLLDKKERPDHEDQAALHQTTQPNLSATAAALDRGRRCDGAGFNPANYLLLHAPCHRRNEKEKTMTEGTARLGHLAISIHLTELRPTRRREFSSSTFCPRFF